MGELFSGSITAQQSVIGSMLVDDRCIPVVLAKMREEDFTDGTCRSTFRAIKKLTLAGRPADPVTVVDELGGKSGYSGWVRDVMIDTPTAANVEAYIDICQRSAALLELRSCADRLLACTTLDEAQAEVRRMSAYLSATSRMPRMTAADLAKNFLARMSAETKPEYLPWGLPTADRTIHAELGDLVLLGGYPSAGKTLLSILMALAQAKRYKVGYYSLETRPEKMADRMFAHLAKVSLGAIKLREFSQTEWGRMAEAANQFVTNCPFDVIRAAGSSVDDIASDAIGRGYQIIYVDYLQLIEAPGVRPGDRYGAVTAVSRGLKLFAQSTNTAVVALAQLARPEKAGKGEKKMIPPSMQSFRESGQIEQDADAAFLLWAEDANDNRSRRVLKLGKNKEGEKFRVSLDFDGRTQTMVEVEDEPQDTSVAAHLVAMGRAAKAENRRMAQMKMEELTGPDDGNPFKEG